LFHKKVNGQKPNLYVEKYIKDRLAYINSGKKLTIYQPIDSSEKNFCFIISCNNAKVKVQSSTRRSIHIPDAILPKSMCFFSNRAPLCGFLSRGGLRTLGEKAEIYLFECTV